MTQGRDDDSRGSRPAPDERFDPTGAVAPPIHPSATFAFRNTAEIEAYLADPDTHYFYGRYGSPTNDACARAVAALDGTDEALLFSSGMGAISSSVLSFVAAGDRVLSHRSIYGGTMRLFREMLPRYGVDVSWFDGRDAIDAIRSAPANTRILYFESPTNPVLEVIDIAALCGAAHDRGMTVLFDGTFASPVNQRPYALGVDVVIHSATKFLGGHADLVAGTIGASREHVARLRATMKVLGTNLDPFAAYLLHRGLKTLELRVLRQNESAMRVAEMLASHPRVRHVHYPGLPSHPGHAVARRQMSGFGGIVTFEVEGGFEGARRVVDRLRVVINAPSLGGVDSLVSLPVLSSHHGLPPDELARAGVTDGMIRLSIGVESVEEILSDLRGALDG